MSKNGEKNKEQKNKDKEIEEEDKDKLYNDKDRSSLLKVMGKAIGVDLTAIPMPVIFNEPISLLQKLYEINQNYELLNKANKCPDPDTRLMYVCAYIIANFSATERMSKPFNPMLGETFEFRENGMKFVSEQVSHHPPISALMMETEDFQLHQAIDVKTKFKGNSLEMQILGNIIIQLKGHEDEFYSYELPKTLVHNIIVGRLWIDHFGDVTVNCVGSKRKAELHFKQCGWFSKGYREVHGTIFNAKQKEMFKIYAKWNDKIIATRLANSKIKVDEEYEFTKDQEYIIWKNTLQTTTDPEFKKWKFSDTTIKMCEISQKIIATFPKSDSRFRPDRISLQNRSVKQAGKDKHRLEEIQRKKRRYREKNNLEFAPKYFEKATLNDIEFWQFNGAYYKEKKLRLKQYKKDKEKKIEYVPEFVVDDINYGETEDPVKDEESISEKFGGDDDDNIVLPEAEEVPQDD